MSRFLYALSALLLIVSVALAGCQHLPLGMKKEEWDRLTPQQQHEARLKQADLDREREKRLAAEAEVRRVEEERQRIADERDLSVRRARFAPVYRFGRGQLLRCQTQGGNGNYSNGWRPVAPERFDVARGDEVPVEIRRHDGSVALTTYAHYSAVRHRLNLCNAPLLSPSGDLVGSDRKCAYVNLSPAEEQRGFSRTFTTSDQLSNLGVRCVVR